MSTLGAAKRDERPPEERADMPLPSDPKTIFLGGLFILALLATLYVAQTMVLPIVIALVLKLLLQPLVRLLERVRVPKAVGALVAVLLLFGVFVGLGAILSGPATAMVRGLPEMLHKLQARFEALQGLLERIGPVFSQFGATAPDPAELVKVNPGSIAGAIAGGASSFASHLLETLLILFYLLVFGETFMRRLVEVLPRFGDKKQAVGIADAVERDISAYLLTITLINAVVGVAAGLVMWAFGVPGALVWGVLAFIFNYVPIIGPIAGIVVFGAVGLATIGTTWAALLPAACYLGLHLAEGEFITPMLLASRFTLNPVAVMISLVFWTWMWGVQGGILSVPLLAVAKIVADRVRPFRAVGHLLEG